MTVLVIGAKIQNIVESYFFMPQKAIEQNENQSLFKRFEVFGGPVDMIPQFKILGLRFWNNL